jgi:hypothetical protein
MAFFDRLQAGGRARAVVTALRQGGVGERRGLQQEIDEAELTAMLEELLF